ncbi:MAG: ParA family protein [Planctomycetes bacterium]|nr:ParA family protein [Planctomycetota bacterium]
MTTIAVINQKGGVGKTTTAVNLGAGLARIGKKVLLIDFDPQANLTSHLEPETGDGRLSTYDLLRSRKALSDVVRPTSEANLFLVPSSADLAGVELELAAEIGRETILRDQLARAWVAGARFDYVLVDCPPSLGLLAINALVAADEALVPIQAEFFALQGISRFVEVQGLVQSRLNGALRLAGIVICLWRGQANLSREVREEVQNVFGDVLYETVIRQNVKLAEAPSAARTIFAHAPDSNGAADYAALTQEFLRRHDDALAVAAAAHLLAPEGSVQGAEHLETGAGPA